ncbi:MAG: hypothetical protein HYX86_03400 [Chloroflexi bacterium]|nr:hypothetical protein [Chloroflexota bacterium]
MNIEQILADCLERIEKQGATLEECLDSHPQLREELAPLLTLALQLRAAPQISLSPEARLETRMRLMNLPLPPSETKPVFIPRLVWQTARVFAVLALGFLSLGAGLALASESSLPGDPFYSVKRTLEDVALSLAPSPESAAGLRLIFAERRLQEATAMSERGKQEEAQQLVEEYRGELEAVLQVIAREEIPTNARASIASGLQTRLERQGTFLSEVRGKIAMENLEAIDQALITIQEFSGLLEQIREATPIPFPLLTPTFPPTPTEPLPLPSPTPTPVLPLPTVTPVLPLPTISVG